jgi:putative ABC transport system permease protein
MKVVAKLRSLWRGMRGTAALDAEMAEEFRTHVELRTEDLVRSGLSPHEAARQARLEFGSPEHYADRGRASRGLRPFDDLRLSWLDFKLGFRMLRRYPGLTLVGGLAMAFAIWVGAMTFELITQVAHPRLPLPDGTRVVGIRLWDASASRAVSQSAYDFGLWRRGLQTITDLGAFSAVKQNLTTPDGQVGTANGAEISASGFRVARVTPAIGRVLLDSDEQPGAQAVVVIGHDLWRTRFGGDPGVVGKQVRIGAAPTTVVGVMPEGFAFPLVQSFWVPLRLSGVDRPGGGPSLSLFGRLGPNSPLDDAQAELALVSRRIAADFPDARQHVRAQVMPYAKSFIDISGGAYAATMSVNLIPAMLLLLICSNVALLMFARATARETEIVVRTALGASRARIVTQLFAEALVLSTVAALVGLVATRWGLTLVIGIVESVILKNALPFWISDRISPTTMLFAALLAVLSAIVAGVMPGLRVTRDVGAQLKAGVAGL